MDPLVVPAAVVAAVLLVAAVVLLALWLGTRRRLRRARSERAEAERAHLELELALSEQGVRHRLIREQHELAVQGVAEIVARAEGARYAATREPEAAVRAATAIEDAARATLADLRRVVDVARDGETAAEPIADLSAVPGLVETMREAGLDVRVSETGERLELRPGAELALVRILQEALDNALAHGGPGTRVAVGIGWTADGVRLLVEDDGIRATAVRNGLDPAAEAQRQGYDAGDDLAALTGAPSGRGMTGMRERAELFGGVFTAHTVPGVGFTVQAVFPGLLAR